MWVRSGYVLVRKKLTLKTKVMCKNLLELEGSSELKAPKMEGSSESKAPKRKVYTAEFRRQKVCEFLQTGMGIVAFCRKEGFPFSTFSDWVTAFKKAQPTIVSANMTKDERTLELEKEVTTLKQQLLEMNKKLEVAEADAHAWETMIDVAEEMFGIAIRKKAGTKQ